MNSVLKKLFAVTAVCAAGAAGAFETPPQIFRPGSKGVLNIPVDKPPVEIPVVELTLK